jgi:VIT1/CCC1 family predicted Fe2+/Mn2+ transporter
MTLHELPQRDPNRVRVELEVSGEREVGAIVADMWENGEKLMRQEIALGLAELQVRADKLKQSLLEGAIMGAVYHSGVMVLLASVVLGLSELMAPWLAALLVGLAAVAGGYALQKRGKENAIEAVADKDNPRTQRTVRAMKEGIR